MGETRLDRRTLLKGLAAGALGGLGALVLGQEVASDLVVERRSLPLPGWPLEGFRIALLADLHAIDEQRMERARRAIRLAAAERPDLLVIAGDFTSRGTPWALDLLVQSLSDLPEEVPCLGVMGNHDYASEDPQGVMRSLRGTRLRLLRNELARVEGVAVAGIDDMLFGQGSWACAASHRGAEPLIALLHEPDWVLEAPTNVALQLSGHSHGGQVCLPNGTPLRLPAGARRFWRGFHPDAPRPLYVTRGVGTTGLDLRLWCPPEVSILTLVRA
ncbi:MAG: metallophosphoesterase [Fimbriimonadales bacterium]|nr:metallophosphoesterase [Fimbriimonadales bacterium]